MEHCGEDFEEGKAAKVLQCRGLVPFNTIRTSPKTIDVLQPMELSVNKLFKDKTYAQLDDTYGSQITSQLEGPHGSSSGTSDSFVNVM